MSGHAREKFAMKGNFGKKVGSGVRVIFEEIFAKFVGLCSSCVEKLARFLRGNSLLRETLHVYGVGCEEMNAYCHADY